MSNLHEMKVAFNAGTIPVIRKGTESARAGTRTTKTRSKTAKALGYLYTIVDGWRVRSQIRSSKSKKSKSVVGQRKMAQKMAAGDKPT
jgi:outer membrane protein TolC